MANLATPKERATSEKTIQAKEGRKFASLQEKYPEIDFNDPVAFAEFVARANANA